MCPYNPLVLQSGTEGEIAQPNNYLLLALRFAAFRVQDWEAQTFLQDFIAGKLAEWPEFREYVDEQARQAVEGRQ